MQNLRRKFLKKFNEPIAALPVGAQVDVEKQAILN